MIDVLHAVSLSGRLKGHQNQPHTHAQSIFSNVGTSAVTLSHVSVFSIQQERQRQAKSAKGRPKRAFSIFSCVNVLSSAHCIVHTVCTRLMVDFVFLVSLYACLWLQSLKRNTIHSTCRPIQSKHTSGTKSSEKYI